MTEEEIDEILNQHDIDHNHEISFKEFEAMILDNM